MSAARGIGGKLAWRVNLPDEAASAALAGQFARALAPPCAIYLYGDLGAGKTLFTRACVHALGFEGYVKSPSYGLLETYRVSGLTVLHLDLYRIEDPEELEYLAIRDLYREDTVLMVEWPDKGSGYLPAPDVALEFDESDEGRFVNCHVFTGHGKDLAGKIEV
jgi:tRNA threonylcarbamoyladenosine biosynthesis protein TsaE